MDKITNLKEVIKNSLRELMEKEQKNKVTTTISKKKKIKEAAFNMLNESCTCMTANTGPGANSQPFIPVYNTCASSQGNAVIPVQSTWCCTHMIHPQDICDDSCLDSNNPCFGNIEPPVLPTGGKPFGQLPADISSLTKDTRTRGVKPTTDRDFMSKDRMLNENITCNAPGTMGGSGNRCGANCDGILATFMPTPSGGGSGCICSNPQGCLTSTMHYKESLKMTDNPTVELLPDGSVKCAKDLPTAECGYKAGDKVCGKCGATAIQAKSEDAEVITDIEDGEWVTADLESKGGKKTPIAEMVDEDMVDAPEITADADMVDDEDTDSMPAKRKKARKARLAAMGVKSEEIDDMPEKGMMQMAVYDSKSLYSYL